MGPSVSSNISGKIFEIIGQSSDQKNNSLKFKESFPDVQSDRLNILTKLMWNNYGRVFSEYILKEFRSGKLVSNIKIEGQEILDEIKKTNKPVVFVSGHFSNFANGKCIEKHGISLSAIYRPLNNIFLNIFMERIRTKYICKKQIKKGIGGMRKLIDLKKKLLNSTNDRSKSLRRN